MVIAMKNWRDEIVGKVQNQSCSVILIYDEDYLLNDELLVHQIKDQGYDVIRYEDSISYRYMFESQYRLREDDWKLIIYTNGDIAFPYDLWKDALHFRISMSSIFPKFSTSILRSMNREDLDALYTVHAQYQGSSSSVETLEYIVKYMYKIPFEIIDNKVELYKVLLSIHYHQHQIPISVREFLVERFQRVEVFRGLPIQALVCLPDYFYSYMEHEWRKFLEQVIQQTDLRVYEDDPLAHPDVRRLMNDLFLKGLIPKVKGFPKMSDLPIWMRHGIEESSPKEELEKRLLHLSEKIDQNLEVTKWYRDWIQLGSLVAEFKYTALQFEDGRYGEKTEEILAKVNGQFQNWMMNQFPTFTSLSPLPTPKMVHHIPHVINSRKKIEEKVALLVLDGMSFVQWKQVKDHLKTNGFTFEDDGLFAWVPTLTSVSRQAIFSGQIPYMFGSSIHNTSSEEKLWKIFWESQGIVKQYVAYQRGLGRKPYQRDQIIALKKKSVKVFGAVIDVIDQFIHHSVLGEKTLVSNMNIWLNTKYLVHLLTDLMDEGYTVYITSDHGNTIARGTGRVSEGVLVDQRGERVRIYSDQTLYQDSLSKIPSIPWSNVGLPDHYYVLLSEYGNAFVTKGEELVTHGGISIEEVIVPFVKMQRK